MSKESRSPNDDETRDMSAVTGRRSGRGQLRHSSFLRHSCFDIGHSHVLRAFRSDHATLAQALKDLHASAVQPGLNGADRAVECQGDRLVRLALFVVEDEDLAVFLAEGK